MSDQQLLHDLIQIWRRAATDFVALAREVPQEKWHDPTDLDGWDVKDNVAHTAHLEAVLAGAPEETVEIPEQPHIKSLTGWYTEQGVVARRERDVSSLADEIEESVATRHAALVCDPPTETAAMPPRTPGGVPWSNLTLLSNRPLDIWMHEQDIRRAIDSPGGYDSPAAAHTMAVLGKALPMVLGKRVGAAPGTSVVIDLPEAGQSFGAVVGDDGRATSTPPEQLDEHPAVRITLSAEDFVVLAGGRRPLEQTSPTYDGDAALGEQVLRALAVTP